MIDYIKKRLPEITSRIGAVIAMLPSIVDLQPWQNVVVVVIGVVLFGVPEDKFKRG